MTYILAIVGVFLLIGGAELLVRAASRLARAAGVSPLIVGLTIVAVGTSSPEIAVTMISALNGESDLAVGNVVGSNLANVMLIGGACALLLPLIVGRTLVRFHVPVMLATAALGYWLGSDGTLGITDGAILLGVFALYLLASVKVEKREAAAEKTNEAESSAPRLTMGQLGLQLVLMIAGLGGLLLGSDWIVKGAVQLATVLGVGQVVIGLTIVAVGTSLPEIATSVLATIRGERDIAIGNIVGSNIANVLCVLGAGCLASGGELKVSEGILAFDFPFMLAVSLVCVPIFWSHTEISRLEGALLLGGYALYVVQTVGAATSAWWAPYLVPGLFGYLGVVGLYAIVSGALARSRKTA